ncbi:hypothetical protein SSP531S_54910 [Streptomyces spongiicola]|uniref:Peptidase S11 D-alanyl-D-alanine carboxypeptidase A N-terminal domain-containing protein n=1 Tax=Streptomyces spongiicola TaxID=1690221 RepID=A0A388T6Y4_9ACTN|nr:hypothetical protein SSP531S_54910 [Streptomyces spongiicola]
MAGESPDRSEQQKSSGETTPGERDPRLAVVRSEGVSSEGRTDQPTAVFRTPSSESSRSSSSSGDGDRGTGRVTGRGSDSHRGSHVGAGEDTDTDGDAPGAGSGSRTATESGAPEGRPSGGGDRLREAVTAWHSGTDEPGKDAVSGSAEADADDRLAGSDTPEVARGATEVVDEGARRSVAPAPRKSVDVESAVGPDAGGRGGRGGRGGGGGGGGNSGEDGARARAPRWAATRTAEGDDATAAEDEATAEGPDGAEAIASADAAGAGEDGGDEGNRTPAGKPVAVGTALPRSAVDQPTTALKITPPVAAPKQAVKPSTATSRPGTDRTGSDREGSEREAERTTALRVTAPPSGSAKPGQGPAAKPAAESDDRPDAEGAAGSTPPSGGGGVAAPAPPVAGAASASEPKSASKSASGPDSASASASKPGPGRASGGAPESAAESAAERTSTFVPLRRDDAPSASKSAPPGRYAAAPSVSVAEPERTRQQPMPPKPPLDLLAELTNTPPPPQTPVRTLLRRVRIWTPLVVLLLIVFAVVQTMRPLPENTLSLTAEPAYTFEGAAPQLPWPAKGQAYMAASGLGALGSSGEQKPVPIASVTKSMTAYVILKNHPLKPGEEGPVIEIDAKGESDGQLDKTDNESTLNTVKKGDKISLRDALAAIMIPSANNIARQLARWDSGSEKAFVEKMNAAAEELGMENTTYTDPSGLDATTVSTAEDQVKLGLKLVEIKALTDITKLPEWTDPSGRTWRNYNELPPFDGALGIKTGSTTKAGGNLLFAAHKMVGDTDQLIVGAVLAQYDTPILGTAIKESKELMLATQDALKNATVVEKGQVVGLVEDGLGGSVPVVATKDVRAVGWSGLTVKLELTDGGKVLPHEAAPGTVVGSLTVGEGASQVAVPVALQQELAEPGFGARLTRLG